MVAANNLIFASANGTVYAMDAATGIIQNGNGNGVSYNGESSELRMIVANNNLYMCSASGWVYCLSLDGNTSLLWQYYVGSSGQTNLIYGNGALFVGYGGYTQMIDPNSGTQIGDTLDFHGDFGEVRFAMNDNILYAGLWGVFYIVDTNNFNSSPTKIVLSSTDYIVNLLFLNGNIYAGTHGSVYGYTGDGNTSLGDPNPLTGTNAYDEVRLFTDNTNIYAGTNGYICSINPADLTNNASWPAAPIELPESQSTLYDNNLRMICNNGYIFVGCFGNLFKLQASNGFLYPGVLAHGYEVPIALNGDGICAMFTGTNVIVNGQYVSGGSVFPTSYVMFVSCVSQASLT
jgi:hypothetical protein